MRYFLARCRTILIFSLLLSAVVTDATAQPATRSTDPLKVAKWLAGGRYNGWKYGRAASEHRIDCVQFVLAVVQELVPELPDSAKVRILIADVPEQQVISDAGGVVSGGDPKTRGVQQALVEMGRGETVALEDARPGDFVQYWMKRENGKWFGHAGIVEKVEGVQGSRRATLFAAHSSLNGIGSSKRADRLHLTDKPDRRIYVARLKPD